jgi:hypothetical protein
MAYCQKHDTYYDVDFHESCKECLQEESTAGIESNGIYADPLLMQGPFVDRILRQIAEHDMAELDRRQRADAEAEYLKNTEVLSADLAATGGGNAELPRLWPTPDAEPQRGMQMGVLAWITIK